MSEGARATSQYLAMAGTIRLSQTDHLIIGGVSGILARTLSAPLDVMKLLMQVDIKSTPIRSIFSALIQKEGLIALWKGNGVALINQGCYSAIKFGLIKEVELNVGDKKYDANILALTGAFAGVVSQVVCFPLDLIRTRMIVRPEKYHGIFGTAKTIVKEEGIYSLWAGLMPTLIGSIPYEGSQYFLYGKLRQLYQNHYNRKTVSPFANVVIGSLAGMFSQSVAYPFETVRKLMMITDDDGHKIYTSMTHCFVDMYKKEGLNGLYRGMGVNLFRVIPYSALQYTLYDETSKLYMFIKRRLTHK